MLSFGQSEKNQFNKTDKLFLFYFWKGNSNKMSGEFLWPIAKKIIIHTVDVWNLDAWKLGLSEIWKDQVPEIGMLV